MTDTIPTPERTFLSVADTAKLLRTHLKREFPGVKFSVRSSRYAGGASIDVSWTDGPAAHLVDPILSSYAGARFDGMIDMANYVQHWLEADGTVTVAHDPGTEMSRGSRSEHFGSRRTADAVLVHLGADYVHGSRILSPEFIEECGREITGNGTFGNANYERCDGCGNWPGAAHDCFVAKTESPDDWRRINFVCSPTCGGRIIARYRTREV